jgi:putative FmdB family regulatory protein
VPIYEYACRSCEQEFEELSRSMDKPEPVQCPACGGAKVERRFSVFAARQSAEPTPAARAGGCGRCGDPSGPCSM